MKILTLIFTFTLIFQLKAQANTNISHAIAMHGEPKYSKDFENVEYINPNSIKGGSIVRSAIGTYDSFNPFILKGTSAAGIGGLYETLTTGSSDEAFTEYGLLAETIEWPDDRSWVSFTLRNEAYWHDGKKITADDVVWTFNTLMEKGHPFYKYYYGDVKEVIKEQENKVRFNFTTNTNKELVLIVGQLPVLPKHYWENKNFEETSLEIPIGSGPYKIKSFDSGRSITYELDQNYWGFGASIPIKIGKDNFGTIRYDYYKDRGIEREAFKSGEIDFFSENSSKEWATAYDINAVNEGLIKKELISHENPQGMQGFAFNIRKDKFKDRRVRKALSYAFDFEWTNRNLFNGQYTRTRSYFSNSDLAARGKPEGEELAVLEPFRGQVPGAVFGEAYAPPVTDGSGWLRENLRRANALLQDAGWAVQDLQLVNAKTGAPFRFEILLVSPAFERIVLPYVRNLKRLGIEAKVRLVDENQYINRFRQFDFDMMVWVWGQSETPGNEQYEYWSQAAADSAGSRNLAGVRDPVVDELIGLMLRSDSREQLNQRTRALDRVLSWGHYVVPHWHIRADRILYWDKFGRPETPVRTGVMTDRWWFDAERASALEKERQ